MRDVRGRRTRFGERIRAGAPGGAGEAMTARNLMSQADFARHRGVSKPAVSNWKKQGLLAFAEGADGRTYVDVARTDAKLNARLDPMRGRPTGGVPAPAAADPAQALPPGDAAAGPGADKPASLADERLLEVRERRFGSAMRNARDAGELAPVAELEQRANAIGRAARERVHAMFRDLAERFAAEKDSRTIIAVGEAEIDRVFAELADAADAGEFGEPDEAALDAEEEAAMERALAAADEPA